MSRGLGDVYKRQAADVRDAQSMRDAAAAFMAVAGVPDVVIANAGISAGTDLREAGDLPAFAAVMETNWMGVLHTCLLYTSPSPRDKRQSRMPSSA
uniref:Uncharacterized protein n=1 Tax=Ralstonia solanacearum TaxID=305 RepID=A0A0S4U180_RALSL|nr:protein of unknown function [Ralstonia solanacearum]